MRTAARPLVAALLLAVAMTIGGCGGAGVLPAVDIHGAGFGTNASGTVRLWARAGMAGAYQFLTDRFNATHRGVHVELTIIPDTQYVTKFATAVRGRDVPDVVGIDDINSTLLAYHDALTNMTPLLDQLPFKKQLSPGHLNLATISGRAYAIPVAADISVLFYNKRIFAAAGLDPNRPPRTTAGVLSDARAITAKVHNVKGYSIAGDNPGILGFTGLPIVWASHTHLFSGPLDSQHVNVAHNQAMHKLLQLYRTMWTEQLMPSSDRTDSGATWGKDFLAGTVGMWPGNWASLAGKIPANLRGQVGATVFPGVGGGRSEFDGGDNISIPRGASNPSGAWEFIEFALEAKQQAELPASGFTPVRSDVDTAQFRKKFPLDAVALANLKSGYAEKTLAYNLAINQTSSPFTQMITDAVFGGNVDSVVNGAQTGFVRALQEAED
ncbi:MAG TPA: sugar ABC transporter substrate-binding protein [Jatrophihabitantaceae bacterium]|jgi:multiple sugar transport system substrate-binding protein|nr:sugar ABC transporter substrate-binding protein [Jatrophihabitantaceae bacterium]